jgi:hypothetical protein
MKMKVTLNSSQIIEANIEPAELMKSVSGPYGFIRCTDPATNLEFWLGLAHVSRLEKAIS